MSTEFNAESAVMNLELDASQFKRETKRAKEVFADFAGRTGEKIQTVRQQFTNYLVNDLAGNAIKGAFEKTFEFLGNFANESKELVKVADAFQLPIQAASELQAVAKGAEVELKDLAAAANALSLDALEEEAPGLGLDMDDLQTKDAAERLALVIDQLQKIPDATKRAQTATRLFGDSAEDLAPILEEVGGSAQAYIDAAREAGLITNADAAEGAAQFADALEKLKGSWTGLANALAVAVLPAFQEGAELLTEFAQGLAKLTGAANDATNETSRFADAATKAREKGDELRKLDADKFSFVSDLAGQGTLVESTFEEAKSAVEALQDKYGDLGFTVDEATRSITAATDAQERFNQAAKEQRRAELQKEIEAGEANERALQEKSKATLEKHESFGAVLTSAPRVAGNAILGDDFVTSAEDKWAEETGEIGDAIIAERKRLNELRKELNALDEEPERPTEEKTAPPVDVASDSIPSEEEKSASRVNVVPDSIPSEEEKSASRVNVVPDSIPSERVSINESDSSGDNPRLAEARLPVPSQLDREIADFERRQVRAGRTSEQNELADARQEESDYRAKLEERIVEERSKGKSGQDAALIETLTRKIEESKTREETKVAAIKEESETALKESDWKRAPEGETLEETETRVKKDFGLSDEAFERFQERAKLNGYDDKFDKQKDATTAQIEKESQEYRELLETRLSLAETDEEREEIEKRIDSLQTETSKRKEDALKQIDEAAFADALIELQNAEVERIADATNEIDATYEQTNETIQSTPAMFSAFDAANAAQNDQGARELEEARRQTRLLEDIYRAAKAQTATFA